MLIKRIEDMKGGWFIGDFEPTAYHSVNFEVCYKEHKSGEYWDAHYHELATEINYLISGKMEINGVELNEGDIFIIYPNEVSKPVFIDDCSLIVVKTPSVHNDKIIV